MSKIQQLVDLHEKQLQALKATQKRYLFDQVKWGNRLNIITGMRGVGKTTMILQYISDKYAKSEKALYISGDNTMVSELGLLGIALAFEQMGGKYLAIDEIHKYPNWKQELKNIYDSLPSLKVVVSGSSSIDIIKGQYDLSRRAIVYNLQGLSFREFINFSLKKDIFPEPFKLNAIIAKPRAFTSQSVRKLAKNKRKVLRLFRQYIEVGYYPYFLEGKSEYILRVNNALAKVIYEDIPAVYKTESTSVKYIQKLIYLIASSPPFTPNISRISSDLGISRDSVYLFLEYLSNAGILNYLPRADSGVKSVRKPEKIYLDNPNLFYAVESKQNLSTSLGAIREAFALNQLQQNHRITAPENCDFSVDNKYLIEIGGPNKKTPDVKGNGKFKTLIAKDGIETGFGNVLPLWALGFLY